MKHANENQWSLERKKIETKNYGIWVKRMEEYIKREILSSTYIPTTTTAKQTYKSEVTNYKNTCLIHSLEYNALMYKFCR